VRQAKGFTEAGIHRWLLALKLRKDIHGKPAIKKAQVTVVEKVANRICLELSQAAAGKEIEEPLIWCMHGLPGTGKSKVLLLLKELFTEVCGWQMGLEYQMAALQAVMAQQLGGDTLHHACGLNRFAGKGNDANDAASQRQAKVAERVLQWRWLIIDEISMVSSALLAEVDVKLRDIVRRMNTLKRDSSGNNRAFGGINILLSGVRGLSYHKQD
jgi:hypothetical protein